MERIDLQKIQIQDNDDTRLLNETRISILKVNIPRTFLKRGLLKLKKIYLLNINQKFVKIHTYTVLDRKDCTPALLWSKTTLITGGEGGARVDPAS